MDPAARAEADQLREPSGPTLTGTVDVSSTLVNIGRAYDVRTGTRSLARVTVQDHDEGPPELTLSDSTQRYEHLRLLGRGGMGQVDQVWDQDLMRKLAIKRLRPERAESGEAVRQFLWEARVTAYLDHPNIVTVHDMGLDQNGALYFTMKRVRGRSLAELIEALHPWTGGEIWLRLIAFDQGFETIYEGPIAKIERSAFDRLHARRALGASNLVSVLRHTGARRGHDVDRVILFSDVVATAGVSERSAVLDSIAELADNGIRRLDVIADAGRREQWTVRDVVRRLPESGLVLDDGESPRAQVRRLLRTVHDNVRISVPGARWYYPDVIDGVQSDDEILVFADVEPAEGGLRVNVESHSKESLQVPLLEVEEPLVGWALESARADYLVATLESNADAPLVVRKQAWQLLVNSSTQNRVVNDYTRLVMLGDEDDYRRAKLDPAALPDVLFAGPGAVQRRQRGVPNALVEPDVPLMRERLPRFANERMGAEQLLLLAAPRERGEGRRSEPTDPDADAVAVVGELAKPGEVLEPTPLPELDPPADSPAAELERLRRAIPLDGHRRSGKPRSTPPKRRPEDAYQGNLLAVMNLIAWGNVAEAKQVAWRWREAEPADVMAVVALGEALEANLEIEDAARAYGSIIDMFPDRADMRRFAGTRLEHLGSVGGRLAIDTYRRAREQRPDHPSSHRLLAFALLRAGRHEQAFSVLAAGLRRDWTHDGAGEFAGVEKVLREDLGLIAAVWLAHDVDAREQIMTGLRQVGAKLATEPSLRFVLTWETGANDVDLHVRDVLGSHAYYDNRGLDTGGALYYDVTDGFGPEVFTILGQPTGYPYNLQIHYYARGPSGYGMGKVQILEHDGRGRIEFDERPFVVMRDRSFVDLGTIAGPLGR
ncbi:MAG: tetratricopeptide repeat protein [Myxococcales bacterium]|nr:tetratricopeptide repeat protein [Myxococcales bacterium]